MARDLYSSEREGSSIFPFEQIDIRIPHGFPSGEAEARIYRMQNETHQLPVADDGWKAMTAAEQRFQCGPAPEKRLPA